MTQSGSQCEKKRAYYGCGSAVSRQSVHQRIARDHSPTRIVNAGVGALEAWNSVRLLIDPEAILPSARRAVIPRNVVVGDWLRIGVNEGIRCARGARFRIPNAAETNENSKDQDSHANARVLTRSRLDKPSHERVCSARRSLVIIVPVAPITHIFPEVRPCASRDPRARARAPTAANPCGRRRARDCGPTPPRARGAPRERYHGARRARPHTARRLSGRRCARARSPRQAP